MNTKLNLKKKPEQLLLFTAIALLFILIFFPIAKLDFQDVKLFSVPVKTIFWIIPLFHIFLWVLYLLTKKFLYSIAGTWIHTIITFLVTILILTFLFVGISPSQRITENHETIGNVIQILFIIFVFVQLFFVANILLGALTTKRVVQDD
jgi:hypothetical protein